MDLFGTKMNSRKEKIDWIYTAKGIGIILVVFGHMQRGIYRSSIELGYDSYYLLDAFIYSFHMPLFFLLSGIFFESSLIKKGKANYLYEKVTTLLYPLAIWSIIQGSFQYFFQSHTNSTLEYSKVVNFLVSPQQQMWFLLGLFFVTCFFIFLNEIVFKYKAITFILLILFNISPVPTETPYWIGYIYNFAIYFYLGILFSTYLKKKKSDINALYPSLFFVIFVGLFLYLYPYIDNRIVKLFLSLSGIYMIFLISNIKSIRNSRIISMLGVYSLYIYLLHILFGTGLRVILAKFPFDGVSVLIACTLCGLILPIFVARFCRNNILGLLFQPKR
ncbi:acyltransferase family protein [Vibrio parahaemolyticus]|nr:acyltransferase [Vibrio parahaemolyticus]